MQDRNAGMGPKLLLSFFFFGGGGGDSTYQRKVSTGPVDFALQKAPGVEMVWLGGFYLQCTFYTPGNR